MFLQLSPPPPRVANDLHLGDGVFDHKSVENAVHPIQHEDDVFWCGARGEGRESD